MNIHTVVAFFLWVGITSILHYLLYKTKLLKRPTFWKKTDYFWLSVALIGLWGVSERYMSTELSQKVHRLELDLDHEYQAQQSWILTLMSTQIQTLAMRLEEDPNQDVFIRKKIMEPTMSLHLYTNIQLALANKRPYCKHEADIREEISDARSRGEEYRNVADEAEVMLKRAIPLEKELEQARQKGKQSTFSKCIAFLSPFMIAVALAVRFTKVTAETFIVKPKLQE